LASSPAWKGARPQGIGEKLGRAFKETPGRPRTGQPLRSRGLQNRRETRGPVRARMKVSV